MTKTYTFNELWNRIPELMRSACANCEQSPKYHPEGNVDIHIRLVFEHASNHFQDVDLMVCAIFHDLGKPETQRISEKNGVKKITNYGHETKSEKYIDKYFHLFSDITTNKKKIVEICNNHMKAHLYKDGRLRNPNKRAAFESLKYFKDIMKFAECDAMGKTI